MLIFMLQCQIRLNQVKNLLLKSPILILRDLVDQNVVKETANPLEGNVSKFDLEFDNAVETESGDDVINMVEEGEELEFGPIDFADDAESVGFTVPEGDKLSVDLTAGERGDVDVTAGEIKNNVYENHA